MLCRDGMRDALYHFAFSIPPSFCLTAKCHRLAEAEGRLGSYRNPQNLLRAFRGTLFPVHRTNIHYLAAASLPTGEGLRLCFIPLRRLRRHLSRLGEALYMPLCYTKKGRIVLPFCKPVPIRRGARENVPRRTESRILA